MMESDISESSGTILYPVSYDKIDRHYYLKVGKELTGSNIFSNIFKNWDNINIPIPIIVSYLYRHSGKYTFHVKFTIKSSSHKNLNCDLEVILKCLFSIEFPRVPPEIFFDNLKILNYNELYIINENVLNLCDYCPVLSFLQLIMNCYCLISDILNYENILIDRKNKVTIIMIL
jgi:hypothetical protein